MLKSLRRNVKSLKPILWLIVATFIIAIFAIWGAGGGGIGGADRADTLATVGGDRIVADEYFQDLRDQLEAIKKQFGGEINADLIQQLGLPQQVLERIVQRHLLLKIAADMGLKATDAEVRDRILSYPAFQIDGKFVGFELYKRVLDDNRIPLADFERRLRQDVVVGKVVRLLTAGIFVTDEEVWEAYRKQNDSAKVEYLVAETAKTEVAATPSEADLRARFDKDPAAYRVPEKRTADYVVVRTEDLKKEIAVKDAEIETYYRDNQAQFQEPDKVRVSRVWLPYTAADKDAVLAEARDIQARAAGGEDFAALARAKSKDDKAATGGDWGLFDWRSLTAEETGAVAGLEAGGVSGVVETETGAAVLKVTEKAAAEIKPLAEVSATIKGLLTDEKARALVAEKVQRLEKLARREKSLDVAAQKEGLKPASTGAVKKGDPLGDVDTSGAVSEALFGLEVKGLSAPIFVFAGQALAELKAVEPERPAKFEEVRAEVEKDALDALKKDRARARLVEAVAALKADWNAEAAKHGLEYKLVETHKKEQYLSLVGERPEIDALVFGAPLQQVSAPAAVDEGFAVFRVLERKEASREEFDKVKAAERDSLLEQKQNKFLSSYMAKAREDKKVRIDYDAFVRINNDILARYGK